MLMNFAKIPFQSFDSITQCTATYTPPKLWGILFKLIYISRAILHQGTQFEKSDSLKVCILPYEATFEKHQAHFQMPGVTKSLLAEE
jgi:hypothetical protein